MYSTGLTLVPGNYRVVPSKEGCTFEPKEKTVYMMANQLMGVYFTCSCKKGPDLVTTEISYLLAEGTIYYKIKNIGDEKTNAYFKNALYIDGTFVSEDLYNAYINTGEEVLRKFTYSYNPTPPIDLIKVCADYKNNLKEYDETNNCLEIKKLFPDLVVLSFECNFKDKVAKYTIKNAGEDKVDKPFEVALYIDGALKEIQNINKVINPNDTYSSSFTGYITPCSKLNVKITVDVNKKIVEINEENNSLEKECVCGETPDLVITSASMADKQICYIIKNIGQGSITATLAIPLSFYNALIVDGKQVAEDHITEPISAGQQLNRCFDYRLTPGKHVVRICADSRQNIKESSETNNCIEQIWTVEEKLPDLIVENIQCSGDNKLSVTIKNNSSEVLPGGWTASAEVYFDGTKKGTFNLKNPTSTLGGGIEKANGSSTYITEWNINASTMVKVVADSANGIKESNEQNNSKEVRIEPCVVKLSDLVISDLWNEGDYIYYKIKNTGEGMAGSDSTGNPCSALFIENVQVAEDCLPSALSPGQELERHFVYNWAATPPEDLVKVCADLQRKIIETNENNNCREEILPAPPILPQKACGCFETDHFEARVTGNDGFAVGNVLGGPEAEIITAVDEDASGDNGRFYIYNYKGEVLWSFDARFTKNDRVITGDLWGDDQYEEIAVAIDEDDKVYIYDSNGSLLHSFGARFTPFDTFATGNVYGDDKEEVIIGIDEDDKIYVYSNEGVKLFEFEIPWDFNGSNNLGDKSDHNDAMAVGNVFGDTYEEILLLDQHGDDSLVYIYNTFDGKLILKSMLHVRFTKYDIFTTGDVLGNEREEIIIAIDEDHMIYIYDAMTGLLKCRYAEITPVDAIATGNLYGGSKDEIVIGQDDDHLIYVASEEP
ncbi:MAG: hypothetical protein NTV78_01105 [Caldiserica bacterium]|nr:hypothetical protein [Caldisericota bacterium]